MAQTTREMPVRADEWRPTDQVLESVLKRCIDNAEAGAARDGTREYMAGAVILAVLGVAILAAAGPASAAILLPLVLFGGCAIYMVTKNKPVPVQRTKALAPIGGPGNLPAGFLVHPAAWDAGMAEHVAYIPETQLQAAAEMARYFPGSVDDLLIFTGSIAAHFPVPKHTSPEDVRKRSRELVHVGMPILRDYHEKYPPQQAPAPAKTKKK